MISTLQFHHVGVVTRGLNACVRFYEALGYASTAPCRDPIQKAEIVLLTRADGPMVEIVQPISEESPAMSWARRIDAGAYHTCYEVARLEEAIESLSSFKIHPVMDPVPAVAFGGRRVSFLWGARTGLLELLEAEAADPMG